MKIIHEGCITRNKEVMMGKLLEDYPHITAEGIFACVDYARAIMVNEEVYELPV